MVSLYYVIEYFGKNIPKDSSVWVSIIVALCCFSFFNWLIKKNKLDEKHSLVHMQDASLATVWGLLIICFFSMLFLVFSSLLLLFLAVYVHISFKPFFYFLIYLIFYYMLGLIIFSFLKHLKDNVRAPKKTPQINHKLF